MSCVFAFTILFKIPRNQVKSSYLFQVKLLKIIRFIVACSNQTLFVRRQVYIKTIRIALGQKGKASTFILCTGYLVILCAFIRSDLNLLDN